MKKALLILAAAGTFIGGAVCLSACSGTAEHSVICRESAHGVVIVADMNVRAGEKVILAARPEKGYRLTSFLLNGEVLNGVSFVMPEEDVTVSAQFELVTYTVTYVLGDAVAAEGNPAVYTVESGAELIEPQKEGYEICGWYTYCTEGEFNWNIEDFRVTSLNGACGNLTLYALYYNPQHEIGVAQSENGWCYVEDYGWAAYYGETYRLAVEPDTGYELDYIAVNGTPIEGTAFTMPGCDVEIEAFFKPIEYEITYVLDGGVNSPDNPSFYTVEDGYVYLYDAYKEGHTFAGWCLDKECTQFIYGDFSPYDHLCPITLYACFFEDE